MHTLLWGNCYYYYQRTDLDRRKAKIAMSNREALQNFIATQDMDIRKTRKVLNETGISPRFMDQKCTPDVLCSTADIIEMLYYHKQTEEFNVRSIWDFDYFNDHVRAEYSKPPVKEITAKSEFDKFIAQPLKTLAFSGILSAEKKKGTINYKIENRDAIEFIARNNRNARIFLVEFILETLKQSNMRDEFDHYFNGSHSQQEYLQLRDYFIDRMRKYTLIRKSTEIRRIFPKVLNPLAHNLGLPGSVKGRVSLTPILTTQLLYNAQNFRDKAKPKTQTRQQALEELKKSKKNTNTDVYREVKAVQGRHNYQSEVLDECSAGKATQVHHIFPKSQHPSLAAVRENLITLTPSQHNTKAHPINNTSAVDFDYQIECLLFKLDSVEASMDARDEFYSLQSFIAMLNVGFGDIGIRPNASVKDVRVALIGYRNVGSE